MCILHRTTKVKGPHGIQIVIKIIRFSCLQMKMTILTLKAFLTNNKKCPAPEKLYPMEKDLGNSSSFTIPTTLLVSLRFLISFNSHALLTLPKFSKSISKLLLQLVSLENLMNCFN